MTQKSGYYTGVEASSPSCKFDCADKDLIVSTDKSSQTYGNINARGDGDEISGHILRLSTGGSLASAALSSFGKSYMNGHAIYLVSCLILSVSLCPSKLEDISKMYQQSVAGHFFCGLVARPG